MAPKSKRFRTQAYDIGNFKQYASYFRIYEDEAVKINICKTNNVLNIFLKYFDVQIDPNFEHLKLEGFEYDQVLIFVLSRYKNLSDSQRRFLMKLKHILRNSISESPDFKF